MKLLYNVLDTDDTIDNDVFYFNPSSDDEDMPSFWLKDEDYQIAWHRDNPDRGASSNVESTAGVAIYILTKVAYYDGDDSGGKKAKG